MKTEDEILSVFRILEMEAEINKSAIEEKKKVEDEKKKIEDIVKNERFKNAN